LSADATRLGARPATAAAPASTSPRGSIGRSPTRKRTRSAVTATQQMPPAGRGRGPCGARGGEGGGCC
jgi:hypothetical protein